MLHKLFETLELTFWKIAIPLMTRSKVVHALIRTTYRIHIDQRLKSDIALSLAISSAGFVFGVLVYSLVNLLA
jgi:hypothetical protein